MKALSTKKSHSSASELDATLGTDFLMNNQTIVSMIKFQSERADFDISSTRRNFKIRQSFSIRKLFMPKEIVHNLIRRHATCNRPMITLNFTILNIPWSRLKGHFDHDDDDGAPLIASHWTENGNNFHGHELVRCESECDKSS